MNMKKTVIALSLGLAFGVVASANAAVVTGITIKDVGSTLNGVPGGGGTGTYSPILDGKSGGFQFNALNPSTYRLSLWNGDVGTGTLLGQGAANPAGSFSTGFLFASPAFVHTYGAGLNADITGGALTVSTLDLRSSFYGDLNSGWVAPLDPGTVVINWVNQVGTAPNDYNVSFQWMHTITLADDPSGTYVGFNARWIVEGVAHTAVPVPAAAWLLGSGLISLGAVARRRKTA